ncbi:MAG: hypothetical protein ACKO15_08245, partial [Burkholderiales bacterium]
PVGKVHKAGNPRLEVRDAKLDYRQRHATLDRRCTPPQRSMALEHDATIHRLGIEALRSNPPVKGWDSVFTFATK